MNGHSFLVAGRVPTSFYGVGINENAARLRSELRAFQREQLVVMRQAVAVLVKAERSVLASGSPLKSGTGRKRPGIGPLVKSVKGASRRTQIDVSGIVTFRARGFYGRFHESGISVETKGRSLGTKTRRPDSRGHHVLQNDRGRPYHLTIPKSETLGPVAAANEERVISILGNSYAVFAP